MYPPSILSPKILLILFLWSLPWKGIALWKAAKNNQLKWYLVILVISTLGILEIVYLLFYSKEKLRFSDLHPKTLIKLIKKIKINQKPKNLNSTLDSPEGTTTERKE